MSTEEKDVGRFGGLLLKGSGQASREVNASLNSGQIACAKLAELVQLTLVADGAIIDLRHYAERQRDLGRAERLATGGILIAGGEYERSEALLWQIADPIEASASGFRSYACVPIQDGDGAPLGRIVALQRGQRAFDGHDLKVLRTVADIVTDLVRAPQLTI